MHEIAAHDYLLGFLACDGHYDKNGITISLQIQERDKPLLQLFCYLLGGKIERAVRVINGYRYLRARVHCSGLWEAQMKVLGGRLKRERQWPNDATPEFVAGCLDADGSFFLHHGWTAGEFQHESKAFRDGFSAWLTERNLSHSRKESRSRITFGLRTAHQLAKCWPPFGLTRKRDIAAFQPRYKRQWNPDQLALLSENISLQELAKRTGKSRKAVQLKRWRFYANRS